MKYQKIMALISVAAFFLCCGGVFAHLLQYGAAAEAQEAARQYRLAARAAAAKELAADENLKRLSEIDYSALQKVNGDVVGWLLIPGTEIDYPLLQGTDNEFYLEHTWDKKPNPAGSVFMECCCDPDMKDFNTVLYGHRLKDGSVFGSLKYYDRVGYQQEHPCVYLGTPEKLYRYEVFAAFESRLDAYPYYLAVTEPATQQAIIDYALEKSVIDTGLVPSARQRLLTFSTCTGHGHDTRWVVQATLTFELSLR